MFDRFGHFLQPIEHFPFAGLRLDGLEGSQSLSMQSLLPEDGNERDTRRGNKHTRSNNHALDHDLPPHRIEPKAASHRGGIAELFQNTMPCNR